VARQVDTHVPLQVFAHDAAHLEVQSDAHVCPHLTAHDEVHLS